MAKFDDEDEDEDADDDDGDEDDDFYPPETLIAILGSLCWSSR